MTSRIVTHAYRPKRAPRRKLKAAPLTGPAIVAIASRKRLKLLRAERRRGTEPDDPEMVAWIRRAMLGHGRQGDRRLRFASVPGISDVDGGLLLGRAP
jgi:hypothetical protein